MGSPEPTHTAAAEQEPADAPSRPDATAGDRALATRAPADALALDGAASAPLALLRNGEEAYPAWLEAINAAEREVLFEMYWFDSDATGRRFAEALCARARAGVEVFVMYDAVGSFGADPAMFRALEQAGAKVIEYHPIAPWRRRFKLEAVTRRDHRKIIVCDGVVGFVGGINVCDAAAPKSQGGGGWRDDSVRVRGPAVRELRALFFDTWCALGGRAPRDEPDRTTRARRALTEATARQLAVSAESVAPPPPSPAAAAGPPAERTNASAAPSHNKRGAVTVLGHASTGADRRVRDYYVRRIREARDRVLIANAYFIPDYAVRRALERAARRGVEVRVIVPRDSDVPSVAYAGRATFARLLRAGVHIHEWVEGMMHAKTALIGPWATVGSYNLDYRSLSYNLEVTVATEEPAFVASVEASLRSDLARCQELDAATWAKRPWTQKLLERLHWLLRKIL